MLVWLLVMLAGTYFAYTKFSPTIAIVVAPVLALLGFIILVIVLSIRKRRIERS
jgi:hypothetical protein